MEANIVFDPHVRDVDGVPSESLLESEFTTDPRALISRYEGAGLDVQAESVEPNQVAIQAARVYDEITEDFPLWQAYMSELLGVVRLPGRDQPEHKIRIWLPEQAITFLTAAIQRNYFDEIFAMRSPETGETCFYGTVRIPIGDRHFFVGHWNKGKALTTTGEIRAWAAAKQPAAAEATGVLPDHERAALAVVQAIRDAVPAQKPPWFINIPGTRIQVPAGRYFACLTTACGLLAWFLWLVWLPWWLFAVLMGAALIASGTYAGNLRSKAGRESKYTDAMSTVAIVWIVLTGLLGIQTLNTYNLHAISHPYLVCGAYTSSLSDSVRVNTDKGPLTLVKGWYNGVHWDEPTLDFAKSFVGKWVEFTVHGHVSATGGQPPYITMARTLPRPGQCGDH